MLREKILPKTGKQGIEIPRRRLLLLAPTKSLPQQNCLSNSPLLFLTSLSFV